MVVTQKRRLSRLISLILYLDICYTRTTYHVQKTFFVSGFFVLSTNHTRGKVVNTLDFRQLLVTRKDHGGEYIYFKKRKREKMNVKNVEFNIILLFTSVYIQPNLYKIGDYTSQPKAWEDGFFNGRLGIFSFKNMFLSSQLCCIIYLFIYFSKK